MDYNYIIRKYKGWKKLTDIELAEELRCHRQTICKIRRDNYINVGVTMQCKIERLYDIMKAEGVID